MIKTFSEECKITKVADAAANGTSAVTSAAVDMLGYESVIFVTSYGTAAANNKIKLQDSSDNAVADDFSDIAGSEVDLSGASDEDQWVDCVKAKKRYVKCVATRGTSSTMGDIWAIQYNARSKPISNQVSGTIYGKIITEADDGTA